MLKIKDQGSLSDYVGVNIHKQADGMYNFTQCTLINAIILDIGLKDKYTKPVPAKDSLHLHTFKSSPAFDDNFNYCSILEKLKYLAQTTRPNIMYATHQIAKYASNLHKEIDEAIIYLVKYLHCTCNLGFKFKPNPKKGFDCFCYADFLGNWNKLLAPTDPSTAKSCSCWIIFCAACPIIWAYKLQSQVTLSTTEAEYIALSTSLSNTIQTMHILEEFRVCKFKTHFT